MDRQEWKSKLYWSENGLAREKKSYIVNFIKQVDITLFQAVDSIDKLFILTEKLAPQYADWVMTTAGLSYRPEEEVTKRIDMMNTFKGFMGEFFFFEVFLPKRQCLVKKYLTSDTLNLKTFYNVKPFTEQDFGMDGYCIDEKGTKCAIQVKFWNPHGTEQLKMENFTSLDSQALNTHTVNLDEIDNELFCWLGSMRNVSSWLRQNKLLAKKVMFIDKDCIDYTIRDDKTFWALCFMQKINELIAI